MKDKTENINKIKELSKFYDKLLNHLSELTSLTETLESTYNNYNRIKEMFEEHKNTREWGKVLLCNDFSNLSNNIVYKILCKEIVPQSIVFINLITAYNEDVIKEIEEKDDEALKKTITNIKNYNDLCQKQFKPLKDKLEKIKN